MTFLPEQVQAVGFLDVVGRNESPVFQTPLYKSFDRRYCLFDSESNDFVEMDATEIEEAEYHGRLSWYGEHAFQQDGLYLIHEDIGDVQSSQALPTLHYRYCSRSDANAILGDLACAYFDQSVQLLKADPPNIDAARRLLRKAYRSYPDAAELLIVEWCLGRVTDDRDAEHFALRRIRDRFEWYVTMPGSPSPEKRPIGQRPVVVQVEFDHANRQTKFLFPNDRNGLWENSPNEASTALLWKGHELCNEVSWLSPYRTILLAIGLQARLFEVAKSDDDFHMACEAHLQESPLRICVNTSSSSESQPGPLSLTPFGGFVLDLTDRDVAECAGKVLAVISSVTQNFRPEEWFEHVKTNHHVSKSAVRLALGFALVEIPHPETPTFEILNRSILANAAEHIGLFETMCEQAQKVIELDPKVAPEERDTGFKARVANTNRQLGTWFWCREDRLSSAPYFERARELFLELLTERSDNEDARWIKERLANCTLCLAQLTEDRQLLDEAHQLYLELKNANTNVSTGVRKGLQLAARLRKSGTTKNYDSNTPETLSESSPRRFIPYSGLVSDAFRRVNKLKERIRNRGGDIMEDARELENWIASQMVNEPSLLSHWGQTRGIRLLALLRRGRLEEAATLVDELERRTSKLETLSSEKRFLVEELAKYYHHVGDFKTAKRWNDELLGLPDGNPVPIWRREVINAQLASSELELESASSALERRDDNDDFSDVATRSQCYFSAGETALLGYSRWGAPKLEVAERCFRNSAMSRKPPHPAALHRLAFALYRQDKFDQAIDVLEQLPGNDSRVACLLARIGVQTNDTSKRSKAQKYLWNTWKSDPFNRFLPFAIADLSVNDQERVLELVEWGIGQKQYYPLKYLCRALANRSIFSQPIAAMLREEFVRVSPHTKFLLADYIHMCLMNSVVIENDEARCEWRAWSKRIENSDPNFAFSTLDAPRASRAFNVLTMSQSDVLSRLAHNDWGKRTQQVVGNEFVAALNWYQQVQVSSIDEKARQHSLNGMQPMLLDPAELSSPEFWSNGITPKAELMVSRAISVDPVLLTASVRLLAGRPSNLCIEEVSRTGTVRFKISTVGTEMKSKPKPGEMNWLKYVVSDLSWGVLTKDSIEIPSLLSESTI